MVQDTVYGKIGSFTLHAVTVELPLLPILSIFSAMSQGYTPGTGSAPLLGSRLLLYLEHGKDSTSVAESTERYPY
jgi:hypothetical protein